MMEHTESYTKDRHAIDGALCNQADHGEATDLSSSVSEADSNSVSSATESIQLNELIKRAQNGFSLNSSSSTSATTSDDDLTRVERQSNVCKFLFPQTTCFMEIAEPEFLEREKEQAWDKERKELIEKFSISESSKVVLEQEKKELRQSKDILEEFHRKTILKMTMDTVKKENELSKINSKLRNSHSKLSKKFKEIKDQLQKQLLINSDLLKEQSELIQKNQINSDLLKEQSELIQKYQNSFCSMCELLSKNTLDSKDTDGSEDQQEQSICPLAGKLHSITEDSSDELESNINHVSHLNF